MTDPSPRLARRLLVLRLGALGGAAAVPGTVWAQGPKAGGGGAADPKSAPLPRQSPPAQSGLSDSDPSDPPGAGRGGQRGPQTGISDSDPSDPPGAGRGGQRGPQTGMTDSDPSDPPGGGRGGNAPRQPAGPTDQDPSDPPGRGRGPRGARKDEA